MRRAIGVALVAAPLVVSAQVSLYEFSQSAGTYNEISAADGGTSLGVPTYWPQVNNSRAWVNDVLNDPGGNATQSGYITPARGPGYPIGFNFTFNGDVFDVIGISDGGWISFGKSSDYPLSVWVYNWSGTPQGDPFTQWFSNDATPLTPGYKRNRVAGFGNSSLQMVDWSSLAPPGEVSNIRVATIGTAPNRVCVVQFKDFGLRGDVTVAMNKINFQIRLKEVDNSVEVVFGPMDWVSSLGRYQPTQIGLSGRTNEDYNGRMTVQQEPSFLYDWNNTQPLTSNIASDTTSCWFATPQLGQPVGSGVPPAQGLTWRWVAPACPPPVWPLTIGQISFASAVATWIPLGDGPYEYVVTATNDVTATPVASGTVSDPLIAMTGLQPLTNYFLYVRRICSGTPGVWSMATRFRTLAGGVVQCDGTAPVQTYCSHQNDTIQWLFVSAEGSPLRIEFLGGYIGNTGGGHLRIWDGPAPVGSPTFNAPQGDLTGQAFNTGAGNNGSLFMQLITDNGSCETQDWYLPMQWRIGCRDCTDPLANFQVVDDCDNQQYSVVVEIGGLGGAPSLRIDNTQGVAPTPVNTIGQYTVGPFTSGQAVTITVQNTANELCYARGTSLMGQPCAVVGCGPTTVTHCYGNNEHTFWAYQGEGGQEIGIRFIRGERGMGDDVQYYNGLDLDVIVPTAVTGTLQNTLMHSSTPSTEHALVLELNADNQVSCADPDPFWGTSEEWEFVVACYDGCTQPRASFTTTCADQTHFNVDVTIIEVGNTGSVNITNDGGAASVTATAAGTYTVGPFTSGAPVRFNVVGASVLCSWTSPALNPDCNGIGIEDADMAAMTLFPNPNDGSFTLGLPEAMSGTSELFVLDLAGRAVAQQRLSGATTQHLDLTNLPSGLYTLLLRNNGRTFTSKASIQH
jgi:hypothetical protein